MHSVLALRKPTIPAFLMSCSGGDTVNSTCCMPAGNYITAAAHIITAVIGSGVLSLAWAVAMMGWVAGPIVLLMFSAITWYCAWLLADAYRHPRDTGKRTYTYPGAVQTILGMHF